MFGSEVMVETEPSVVRHQRPTAKPSMDDYEKETGWQPSYSPKPSYSNPTPLVTAAREPYQHQQQQPSSYSKNKGVAQASAAASTTYHHNLPYGGTGGAAGTDSYDPKYNNNPEGHGYQAGYKLNDNIGINEWELGNNNRPRDTAAKPKKVKVSGGGSSIITISKGKGGKKHGKRLTAKVKVTHLKRNRSSLDTELRPPPGDVA